MQIYRYPLFNSWPEITKRPATDYSGKIETVREVMTKIREDGDAAIRQFTNQFDNVDIADFKVTAEEIEEAVSIIDDRLQMAFTLQHKILTNFILHKRCHIGLLKRCQGLNAG